MKNPRASALRWLRQAEHDFQVAAKLLQSEDYSDAAFHSEQSAQKSLKAVLYLDGARFIRIHSIAELIKEVSRKRPAFSSLREEAGTLDQYYLTARYPDAVAEPAIPSEIFTKKQAEEALRIARTIFETSKRLIS